MVIQYDCLLGKSFFWGYLIPEDGLNFYRYLHSVRTIVAITSQCYSGSGVANQIQYNTCDKLDTFTVLFREWRCPLSPCLVWWAMFSPSSFFARQGLIWRFDFVLVVFVFVYYICIFACIGIVFFLLQIQKYIALYCSLHPCPQTGRGYEAPVKKRKLLSLLTLCYIDYHSRVQL